MSMKSTDRIDQILYHFECTITHRHEIYSIQNTRFLTFLICHDLNPAVATLKEYTFRFVIMTKLALKEITSEVGFH
jgi:hypothetical protein